MTQEHVILVDPNGREIGTAEKMQAQAPSVSTPQHPIFQRL